MSTATTPTHLTINVNTSRKQIINRSISIFCDNTNKTKNVKDSNITQIKIIQNHKSSNQNVDQKNFKQINNKSLKIFDRVFVILILILMIIAIIFTKTLLNISEFLSNKSDHNQNNDDSNNKHNGVKYNHIKKEITIDAALLASHNIKLPKDLTQQQLNEIIDDVLAKMTTRDEYSIYNSQFWKNFESNINSQSSNNQLDNTANVNGNDNYHNYVNKIQVANTKYNIQNFEDWWIPVLHQTDDNNKQNLDWIKQIAQDEVLEERREYIYSKLLTKNIHSIGAVSNRKDPNSECVMYGDSNMLKWRPSSDSICPWNNKAVFWNAMGGSKIGVELRKAIEQQQDSHWLSKISQYVNETLCECPTNVVFIFSDVNEQNSLFYNSLRNCKMCNVQWLNPIFEDDTLNNNTAYKWDANSLSFDYETRFLPVFAYMNKIQNDEENNKIEYLISVTGEDTSFVGYGNELSSVIPSFLSYDCDVLIGGAANTFPHWMREHQAFENHVYPWSRHHQHMNANFVMMKNNKKVLKYLTYIDEHYKKFRQTRATQQWKWQQAWRELHMSEYPSIKIDSLTKLSIRMDMFMYDP